MKTIFKKCTSVALALACLTGVGTMVTLSDSVGVSIGITASAAEYSQWKVADVKSVNKTESRTIKSFNGNGYTYFNAFRSGKCVTKITVKDINGKTIRSEDSCIYASIKKWSSNNPNKYARISVRRSGSCKVYIYYNDGKKQIVNVKSIRQVDYRYDDFGYASNFGLVNYEDKAIRENWRYEFGSVTPGAADITSIIWMYRKAGGENRATFLDNSKKAGLKTGYVENYLPRVHGLGLLSKDGGGVATYVGNNTIICDYCVREFRYFNLNNYPAVFNRWFYFANVKYPTTGWVKVTGKSYYYENGEYVVNCSRTLNGVTYRFGADGVADRKPPESEYIKTKYVIPYK